MLLSDKDCSANSPCLLSKTLPLQAAVRAGHADAVGALLEAGADPAAVPDSPLHAAAESGCLLVVDRLLKAGCDPAARNSRGRPPMAVAAREDQIDVMELLLTKYVKWMAKRGREREKNFYTSTKSLCYL